MNKAWPMIPLLAVLILSPAASPTPVDDAAARVTAQLQMRLTHTLYQGTLAAHFAEGEGTFDMAALADRAYLQTFLTEWSKRIESGKYRSTPEIFADLARGDTYLAKYYAKWSGIHQVQVPAGSLDLGANGYREQFLARVLASEARFPDLDQRLHDVLYFTSLILVTSAGDAQLARAIATPFLDAQAAPVREAAQNVLANIPFERKARLVVLGFDLLAVASGGWNLTGASRLFTGGRIAETLAAGVGVVSRTLGRASMHVINPFARRMTVRKWSFAAATTAHAGAGLLFWPSTATPNTAHPAYRANILQMMQLWEVFNTTYPDSFPLNDALDFTPAFHADTLAPMIARVRARLRGDGRLDFGNEFILAEKLRGIDHRGPDDLLVTEYVQNRLNTLRAKVAALFGDQAINDEKIEAFRQLVIEDTLHVYKRDYPNMTSSLINWGGNCVAQAMLMTSLLEPYRGRLTGGKRLVVALSPGHIEAGLYDGRELTTLIAGQITTDIKQTLYRPEFLLVLLLRNYPGALKDLAYPKLVEYWPPDSSTPSDSNKKDKGERKPGHPREGVMDTEDLADLNTNSGAGDDREIPESAEIGYSRTTDIGAQGNGGKGWRDRLSPKPAKSTPKHPNTVTFSINLQPKKYAFANFDFDEESKIVRAFDAATFAELTQARRTPKMDDWNFAKLLRRRLADRLPHFADLAIVQKIYGAGQTGAGWDSLRQLTNLTSEDFATYERAVSEFKSVVTIVLGSNHSTGRPDFAEIADLNRGVVDNTPGATGIDQTTLAKINAFAAGEAVLLKAITRDPRTFLTIYDAADSRLRDHLLTRFFGASFWKIQPEFASDVALLRLAKFSVRDYLATVDHIKVDFDHERYWLCDPGHIRVNLQVVPGWTTTGQSDDACGVSRRQRADVTIDIPKATGTTDANGGQSLELKLSTLIELTVGFGEGLQLWTPDVVDDFVHQRYEPIGPDHATARVLIKRLVETDPDLIKQPRFAPLMQGV